MITKEQYSDAVVKLVAQLADIPLSLLLKCISLAMVPLMIWLYTTESMGELAYVWVLGMWIFAISKRLEDKS